VSTPFFCNDFSIFKRLHKTKKKNAGVALTGRLKEDSSEDIFSFFFGSGSFFGLRFLRLRFLVGAISSSSLWESRESSSLSTAALSSSDSSRLTLGIVASAVFIWTSSSSTTSSARQFVHKNPAPDSSTSLSSSSLSTSLQSGCKNTSQIRHFPILPPDFWQSLHFLLLLLLPGLRG